MWDRFKAAEDRIDSEAIETEVDAAMRGEMDGGAELDAKILAASRQAQLGDGSVHDGSPNGSPNGPDDALSKLKSKMEDAKAAKQKALAAAQDEKTEKK